MPEHAAWYLIGGSAVHLATERWDKDGGTLEERWNTAFDELIDQAFQQDPEMDQWRAGKGYTGRGEPETYDAWKVKGLQCVKDWAIWRKNHTAWELEGIEDEIESTLPSGTRIHGFVDRLFNTPKGRVIVDLKTGSRKPDSLFQLGVYATGYELMGQMERPPMGLYWMSKAGHLQNPPSHLKNWSIHTIDGLSVMMYTGIDNGVFLPIVSSQCYFCFAREACFTFSGNTELSRKYDNLNPEYKND